jgi:hypothetical protein
MVIVDHSEALHSHLGTKSYHVIGDFDRSAIPHLAGRRFRKTVCNQMEEFYAVARCCSRPPRRTLTTLETPSSCMVTP